MGRGELIIPQLLVRPVGGGTCTGTPTTRTTIFQYPSSSECQNYRYVARPAAGWRFSHFEFRGVVVNDVGSDWADDYTRTSDGTYDASENGYVLETLVMPDGSDQGGHNYIYWMYRCPFYIDEYSAQAYYTRLDVTAAFVRDPTHLLVHDDRANGTNLLVYDDRAGGTGLLVADY